MELVRISVPYLYVLALVLAAFAGLGFVRGWAREAVAVGGVIVAWNISARFGDAILQYLNRLARSILFVLNGGIESTDPTALVRSLNETQLADLQQPQVPLAILFATLVIIVYMLTVRFIRARATLLGKIGGSLIGMLNGFLIAFVLLQAPSLQSKLIVSVSLPATGVLSFVEQYTPGLLVALVGIVIVFALFTSLRAARQRKGPGWAEKRRG